MPPKKNRLVPQDPEPVLDQGSTLPTEVSVPHLIPPVVHCPISDIDVEPEEQDATLTVEETLMPNDVIQITDGKAKGIVATLIDIGEDGTVRCVVKPPNESAIRFRVPMRFVAKIGKAVIPIVQHRADQPPVQKQHRSASAPPAATPESVGVATAKDFDNAKSMSLMDRLVLNQAAATERVRKEEEAIKAARI